MEIEAEDHTEWDIKLPIALAASRTTRSTATSAKMPLTLIF